jgi:hypothetical protein
MHGHWQEVIECSLDQNQALIVSYANEAQRVLPELALRSVDGRPVHAALTGNFTAPI